MPIGAGWDSPGARLRTERFQRRREEVVGGLGPMLAEGLQSATTATDQSLTELASNQGMFNLGRPTVGPPPRPTPPATLAPPTVTPTPPALEPSPLQNLAGALEAEGRTAPEFLQYLSTLGQRQTGGPEFLERQASLGRVFESVGGLEPRPPDPNALLTAMRLDQPIAGRNLARQRFLGEQGLRQRGIPSAGTGVVDIPPTPPTPLDMLLGTLRAEVELFRPLTEPLGGALGRFGAEAVIPGVPSPLRALGVPDIPGRQRLIGGVETAGRIVAPEVVVPTSLIPIPIADDILRVLAKGVPLAARLLTRTGRTATRAELGQLAEQATRFLSRTPPTDPVERRLAAEAVETLGREPAVRGAGEVARPAEGYRLGGDSGPDELQFYHGTTGEGAAGIRATGRINPTEAQTGTWPGVHLHEAESTAQISARSSARLTGGTEEVVPVAVRRDVRMATEADELAARQAIGVRGNTADDMTAVAAELKGRGFGGIAGEARGPGGVVMRTRILFPEELAPAPRLAEAAPARAAGEAAPATARAAAVGPADIATARAAGQVPDALAGEPTTIDKLTNLIRSAKRLKPEQRALRTQELGRRAARAEAAMERVVGREQLRAGRGQLGGALPSPEFEAPEGLLNSDEINDLFNSVGDFYRGKERTTFTRINTMTALEKILMGKLPGNAELDLLEQVFGPELVEALLGKRPLGAKVWEELMGVINAPRTLMTTFDVSAILRQAATTVGSREFYGNIPLYLRSFASQRFTESVEAAMRAHPLYQTALDDKLALTFGGRRALPLGEREEAFMLPGERTFIGKLIRKIPGVRQSERGHLTFLSKLRLDMYANNIDKVAAGEGDALASMINAFTGRGEIGPLKDYTPLLSGLMFSARRQASLVQIPLSLFSRSPHVRKLAARNLMAFVGTGVGLLSLLKMSGLADVEMDPRSSNWGKIRVGPTRLDIWAGFQPLARFIAQAATGQKKISSGAIVDVGLLTAAGDFLRNKLSPAAGEAVDVLRGETAIGEEIAFTPEVIGREAYENLTSLFIQDVFEAVKEGGWAHGLLALPAGFGVGVQSYTTPSEELAARFEKQYPDLAPYNPEVHRVIVDADPELSAILGKSEGRERVESALEGPIAALAPVAEQVRQNNPAAGPQFRNQYSDFKKIAFGATSAAFADVDFRDPQSEAGRLRQEFNELNPFSEEFFDVDSAQPDWFAFGQERDRLIGEIDALVPGFKDAYEARLRLPAELQDVETRFLQAQQLRNQLSEIPHFRGISVQRKREIDAFLRRVRAIRDRIKDERGPDSPDVPTMQEAIERAGQALGHDSRFILEARALQSSSARQRLLNLDYVRFIVENADQLLYFYPELRTDAIRRVLAAQ